MTNAANLSPRTTHDFLFELRVDLSRVDEPKKLAIIRAFELPRDYLRSPHHTLVRLELAFNGRVLCADGQIGIPGHASIDGIFAKELALSYFAYDDESFMEENGYSAELRDFVTTHHDEISMVARDRFCDENGNVKKGKR